ncbi:MAG: hypothetical protein WB729_21830 [Candidatus Sulfotelmatobacter sp.]
MAKDFDKELEVMKMYTDNASLYIKLSTAALALTVTFPEKILKMEKPVVDVRAIFIWFGFLLAIGAGAFYQYLAGKYMENLLPGGAGFSLWNRLASQCGTVYGMMLFCFYASAIAFTCNAISRI